MKMQEKAGERKLRWDEENRLLSSDDNGRASRSMSTPGLPEDVRTRQSSRCMCLPIL